MPEPTIDLISFFIFIVPGAITVWTYRNFTKSKKAGDFEYIALSAFWGVIIVAIQQLIAPRGKFTEIINNQYAAAFAFSLFGFIFGWLGSQITKRWVKIKIKTRKIIMIAIFVGAFFGYGSAHKMFMGSWFDLVLWVCIALILGLFIDEKENALRAGGVYGFFLTMSLLLPNFKDTPLAPFWLGIMNGMGIICGIICAYFGNQLRKIAPPWLSKIIP